MTRSDGAERPYVSLREAATQLGITAEAVRLARERGALEGFEVPAGSRVRRYVFTDSLREFSPKTRRKAQASAGISETRGEAHLAAENASLRETNLMLLAASEEDKQVRRHYVKAAEHMSRALAEITACDSAAARTREYLENAIAQWNLPGSTASIDSE